MLIKREKYINITNLYTGMGRLTKRDASQLMLDLERGATDKEVRDRYELNADQLRYWRRKTKTNNPKGPIPTPSEELFSNDEPQVIEPKAETPEDSFQCGRCEGIFNNKARFCPHCGVELGWPQ